MKLSFIYNRTKDIILNPQAEWIKIKNEISKRYKAEVLVPYSILYALGSVLGSLLFNQNNLGFGFNALYLIFLAVNSFIFFYFGTYFAVLLVNALHMNFRGIKNHLTINTLIINALIPFYFSNVIASVFPQVTIMFTILGFYSVYTYWFGIQSLLSLQGDKKFAFFILSSLLVLLIFFILRFFLGSIILYFSDNLML